MSTALASPTREHVLTVGTFLLKLYADEDNPDALPDWSGIDAEQKMALIHAWKEITQPFYGNAKDSLTQEMNSDEATEMVEGEYTAKIVDKAEYNGQVLEMLFEHDLQDELVKSGAVESVTKWVWNATKLKPFAKRGGNIKNIIENARGVKYRTLSITRRE